MLTTHSSSLTFARTVATLLWKRRHFWRSKPLARPLATWRAQLQASGLVVVPGFMSRSDCEKAVEEFDRLTVAYPECVQTRSDARLFGVERASTFLGEFSRNSSLWEIAEAIWREPIGCLTLGARLTYRPGNLGSGEGWHRDALAPQCKAIVYLTDVDEHSGPFELILGSHRAWRILKDTRAARVPGLQTRFEGEEVARIVAREPERVRTVTGAAGTLILANTSAVHRGRPIEQGVRYALTNYYLPQWRMTPSQLDHFSPILPWQGRDVEQE